MSMTKVGEKLVGGQKKLDKDKDGDIDAKDFAMLRKDAKKEGKEKVSELTKTLQCYEKSRETTPSVTKKAIKYQREKRKE